MNFQAFLAQLKYETFLAILPLVGQAATNIAANPTALNIAGQWAKLQVDVLAAIPGLEQTVIQQLAVAINTEIQNLIAQAKPA